MTNRPDPEKPPRPAKGEDGIRHGGGGWQKPVAPPTNDGRPPGMPPKKKS